MAIKIGSNFTFQGEQPNFERDRFATKAAMKAFPETSIDDGHLSYCAEDGNTYQFKSSNSVDSTTGKWRVFKTDIDLSAYATKDSVNSELNKKVNIIGISKSNTIEGKVAYLKVATITMPKTHFQSGLLELFITDRSNDRIDVLVTMDNTRGQTNPIVKVVEITYRDSIDRTPLYYYKDLTGEVPIITLYFKLAAYDTATVKVVDKDAFMPFTYTLNMDILQTLPEGVIQVHHINYGNENLFYATPKNATGNPKFRAINITDLPDLSSKYATKEKAFTKDTVSTAPGQFVAGPATTQGNLYLRKLIADDIPDLKSKYQKLDSNGYQEKAKVAGLIVKHGNTGDTGSGYLIAEIDQAAGGQIGPDWYYATDGTLQDITTKIPKVVLDDAVSTTSDNGVKNSVITKYVDGKVTTINNSIADLHSSLESTQTDFVELRNKVNAMPKTVFITQAAYNALTNKDANTIYYING